MKNKLLLILCIPSLIFSSCNDAQKKKEYIGIVSAMDNEIELLLQQAKIDERQTIGGVTFYVGSLNDKPVIISRSGIGKVRASSGITSLLNSFNVSKIIFTCCRGGWKAC